jgi:hypothetical protein
MDCIRRFQGETRSNLGGAIANGRTKRQDGTNTSQKEIVEIGKQHHIAASDRPNAALHSS